MIPQKTKLRIIELRAQGTSYQRIANALNISKTAVIKHCKNAADDIMTLRAVEVETTFNTCTEFADKRQEGLLFLADLLRKNIDEELQANRLNPYQQNYKLTKNLEHNINKYLQVLKEMNAPNPFAADARATQMALAAAHAQQRLNSDNHCELNTPN